jgi:uncharacterized protein (TIGR02391 family)
MYVPTRRPPDSIPPSLTPHRAIELLRQRLDDIDKIKALRSDDPEVRKWSDTTEAILHGCFGKPQGDPHQMTSKFTHAGSFAIRPAGYSGRGGTPDHVIQQQHRDRLLQKKAVLESCVEQLEILAPPTAQVSPGQYQFHADIERVSGSLFRDGHYKQAALEAYIRVIDAVKQKSGLALDGDNLMNHAFGCDGGRVPVIAFNALSSDEERDEQKGFMFLFKGIVGLRNSKAHTNRLFNDPRRAHEYLALASLLLRVLELHP